MKRNYHTLNNQGKVNEQRLGEFLTKNGQQLLRMVELIAQSRVAIDELVDAVGRATIEAVLRLSAEQVAGPPQQGRMRQGEVVWHGTQAGSVYLKERKLKISKPRLRKKGGRNRWGSTGAGLWSNAGSGRHELANDGDATRWRYHWRDDTFASSIRPKHGCRQDLAFSIETPAAGLSDLLSCQRKPERVQFASDV